MPNQEPIVIVGPDGTEHEFPAGTDPLKAAAIVRRQYPDAVSASLSKAQSIGPAPGLAEKAVEALPTIGGMVGSLAGAGKWNPLGMVGAAAGGAAGATGRNLGRIALNKLQKVPESVSGALQDVGVEAAKQAGLNLGGRALSAGLKKFAPRLAKSVLKPPEVIRREFPGTEKTMIREGTLQTQSGLRRAERLLSESGDEADTALATAAASGQGPVPTKDVITALKPVFKEARGRMKLGMPDERTALRGRVKQFSKEYPQGIPLLEAQEQKRRAQNAAHAAWRAKEMGAKEFSLDDLFTQAQERGLRKGIETAVPDVAPINKRTQELIGLTRALERGLGRSSNTDIIGMRDWIGAGTGLGVGSLTGEPGAGVGAYLATRLLTTPGTGSAIAIGADRLGNVPWEQLVRAALLAKMGISDDNDTPQ